MTPSTPPDPWSEGSPTQVLGALLREASRGDEGAFERLHDLVAPRLLGVVLQVVRDPAQSEEVCQEALLEIWRTSARYKPGRGSALAWMLVIAHRKAVDRVRSSEAARRREATDADRTPQVTHDVTVEAAEASLAAAGVRAALSMLTPLQREALELAYFGGYTHTEVAELLGLPLGTAKTRIRDALKRMRDVLDPAYA